MPGNVETGSRYLLLKGMNPRLLRKGRHATSKSSEKIGNSPKKPEFRTPVNLTPKRGGGMMGPMTYNDLIVLVPSHSLEDFPTELAEEKAEGLLNAFAVLWHPRPLAAARVLPSWHRAD